MRISFVRMPVVSNPIPETVFIFVALCWLAFMLVFLIWKKPSKAEETNRDNSSRWGILLQAFAFFITWFIARQYFTPIVPMPKALEFVLAVLTIALAAGSVWICFAAARTLGKQWTYVARVVKGHKLITEGPYRWVRNPIYTGMLGMLLATNLAVTRWWAVPFALAFFLAGNQIRIRTEEKLLREAFGAEFEDYSRRVPAILPRFF
ncbi:MAG: methyltransferase family protein [Candidatus Acidiferrales bacterium]